MCDLERRVRLAKANVDSMVSIMVGWSKTPLHRRKGDRKDALLNLEVCANCSNKGVANGFACMTIRWMGGLVGGQVGSLVVGLVGAGWGGGGGSE